MKKKIVVIDDHPYFGASLKYKLEKEGGFIVYTAPNGEEGIEMVKQFIPDLVVVDYVMPGMDGLHVCRAIKRIPALRKVILVMLTSEAVVSLVKEAVNAGVKDFIAKTTKIEIAIEKIKKALKDTEESE